MNYPALIAVVTALALFVGPLTIAAVINSRLPKSQRFRVQWIFASNPPFNEQTIARAKKAGIDLLEVRARAPRPTRLQRFMISWVEWDAMRSVTYAAPSRRR